MNIAGLIEFEEGYRAFAYKCSEDYPTIGIGKRIGPKGHSLSAYTFTVSRPLAHAWLMDEIIDIEAALTNHDWFCSVTGDRRLVIISMAYQLGVNGLLKFKRMIAAIEREHFAQAETEAMNSKWAHQTPERANRHAQVIGGKSLNEVYGT